MATDTADQPSASLATEPGLGSSSEDDEDFNPDANPPAELSSESDSEFSSHEATTKKPRDKKRKQANGGGREDDLELEFASGDEATIRKGKRKKQKKAKSAAAAESDEDHDDGGGEGGLIKTRAQRAKERKEKKSLASAANATVDVDALWVSMNTNASSKLTTSDREPALANGTSVVVKGADTGDKQSGSDPSPSTAASALDETITIHRTYTFAGQTTTESQVVPKFSASALLYLQSQSQSQSPPSTVTPPLRRPKKRASLFDPGAPSTAKNPSAGAPKGSKLNTIEKSKLDWAGYVDKEGLKEDLDIHSRAKEGYLGRMDFLGRVEAKREEEGRKARGL